MQLYVEQSNTNVPYNGKRATGGENFTFTITITKRFRRETIVHERRQATFIKRANEIQTFMNQSNYLLLFFFFKQFYIAASFKCHAVNNNNNSIILPCFITTITSTLGRKIYQLKTLVFTNAKIMNFKQNDKELRRVELMV